MIFDNFEVYGVPQVLDVSPIQGGHFHVYINDRFVTGIAYTTQGWKMHFNNNSWLTKDEADIIIEMIESGEIPTI